MITDRMRFTVLQANTDVILSRDLVVKDPQIAINLSAPSSMEFVIPQGEFFASSYGINWQTWGQVVIAEIEIDGARKVFAVGIVTDQTVDPTTGDNKITTTGIIGYAKGIPLLINFNPIAVDPFEIVQRIWAHLSSFSNANLEVDVYPASSGTQMLPGYSFDGSVLNFDFFAVFYRSVDFNDCQDVMAGLARDIPFDMIEEGEWNSDRTVFTKKLHLGYPRGGYQQNYLSFRLGENVIQAKQADEREIQPVSDVIIRGWLPGQVYSAEVTNADPTRYRRTVMEENAQIDSTERAAAWAHRKLTRRNIPNSFKEILIDPNHPSAPLGSFGLGDSIWVSATNYPWVGTIEGWHRIIGITYTEQDSSQGGGKQGSGGSAGVPAGLVKLDLKIEGAFDYDPISYNPDYASQPVTDPNRITNGYFGHSLQGWVPTRGQWIRVADVTYDTPYAPDAGSVRIDCDDHGEGFLSNRCYVTPGEHLTICAVVQYENVLSGTPSGTPGFILEGYTYLNGGSVAGPYDFGHVIDPVGAAGWTMLRTMDWLVPSGINEVALQLTVNSTVTHGTAFWTFCRVYTMGDELQTVS